MAHRLRVTNILDEDLLDALNKFSGYLVASGYHKPTILKHFTDILEFTNRDLVFREKVVDNSFKIALVTDMHPALPNVQKLFDRYYPVIKSCPVSAKVLPRNALISTCRKIANLSAILASNPFNSPEPSNVLKGFQRKENCRCYICREGFFTAMVYPQISKERGFSLPAPINCGSTNVIYLIVCSCGKYYVGRTEHPRPRWSNHKSHIRKGVNSCNLATHCGKCHKHLVGDNKLMDLKEIKSSFKLTLLEALGDNSTLEELKEREEIWRNRLESWAPVGLNTRED